MNALPAFGSVLTAKKTTIISLLLWAALSGKKNIQKREEIIQNTNNHQYSSSYQASQSHPHPAHSYFQVFAHNNSPGHSSTMTSVKTNGGPDNMFQFYQFQLSKEVRIGTVSNAVISVLIATVRSSEVPGTFETVVNFLLTANGLPYFKMGNVTSPTSFPPTPTDTSSLNTQSTFTPSSPDKPFTASSQDHSASNATVFKTKQTNKKYIVYLIRGNKLILKPPLKIDEVIEHLTSNKNNIEVVNLSSTDFD